jgi:hypothetical protein
MVVRDLARCYRKAEAVLDHQITKRKSVLRESGLLPIWLSIYPRPPDKWQLQGHPRPQRPLRNRPPALMIERHLNIRRHKRDQQRHQAPRSHPSRLCHQQSHSAQYLSDPAHEHQQPWLRQVWRNYPHICGGKAEMQHPRPHKHRRQQSPTCRQTPPIPILRPVPVGDTTNTATRGWPRKLDFSSPSNLSRGRGGRISIESNNQSKWHGTTARVFPATHTA